MGLILFNKKPGITSFDALRDVKRTLATGKVGHTGTLDKFAQGLLLVLTEKDLKLSRWFTCLDKQYIGKIHFGIETDTLDPEGVVIAESAAPSRERVEQALKDFTGDIMQAPPAFSAIHINGQRASSLARAGQPPEMKKRPVTIYKLTLLSWTPPFAEIFVHCSSGTYIRSLARDMALAAGSRAHLTSLVRTQVAGFKNEPTEKDFSLLPVDKSVIGALGLPWFDVTPGEAEKIFHGKPLEPILDGLQVSTTPKDPANFSAAVFAEETLVAVVEKAGGKWKYGCVLV